MKTPYLIILWIGGFLTGFGVRGFVDIKLETNREAKEEAKEAIKPSCDDLKVGQHYILYGFDGKGPFEKQTVAPVTIEDMKDGWVKYCWTSEFKKRHASFSRTCEDFIDLMNNKR